MKKNTDLIELYEPEIFPKLGYFSGKWSDSDNANIFEKNKKNSIYGPEDIWYQVNSHGYRGDEFDFSLSNDSIVYIGCSTTYGTGLPLEHTWSKILHNKICSHYGKNLKYYNLSQEGKSNDYITRMAFHAKKLKPLMIFISFTYVWRREIVENGLVYSFLPFHKLKEISAQKFKSLVILSDEEGNILNLVKNLNHIQETLKNENWAFIPPLNQKNYRLLKIPKWVKNHPNKIKTNDFLSNNTDFARDMMHSGPTAHRKGAEEIWEWLVSNNRLPNLP